jgi:hypothetical protein
LLCNEELQWVLLLKKKTSTFAKISGTTKLNPLQRFELFRDIKKTIPEYLGGRIVIMKYLSF